MSTGEDPALRPRNPWSRARHVLALLAAGDAQGAARHLEMIRHHPALPPTAFAIYADKVKAALDAAGRPQPLDTPSAYTGGYDARLRQPFRQVQAGVLPARPYPAGMVLPPRAGAQNDTEFLRRAATRGYYGSGQPLGVTVFVAADATTDVAAIATALMGQAEGADICLTVAGADVSEDLSLPQALSPRIVRAPFLSAQAQAVMAQTLEDTKSDITIFLSGEVVLDDGFLARAWYLARVSDKVVQALVPLEDAAGLQPLTSWHLEHEIATSDFPYRALGGLSFVVATALIRAVGLPDARFSSLCLAAREIGWRMFQKGAYFAPLAVPVLKPARDSAADAADQALYVGLCPNPLDRPVDGTFQRPRVDIYIPTYNAVSYIRRAIDSVLEQDVRDLQVCVADDNSTDGTYALVQEHYADNPQVRVQTGPNGGIGHASNRGIAMGSAPYIGQLDADDCLKPGAVGRLMAWLDAHPETACVYGACERIDAQGGYIKNEFNWPVFTREKMMVTSIAHHFRMFRRAAFARTTQFREDIANAVDYDLLLKLTETGDFHHIDEILYQRRWHGENTSDVNETLQTTNTHIAQNDALHRLGLDRFWDLHIADPELPRQVGYRRRTGVRGVVFWPAPAQDDPSYHLRYGALVESVDICTGTVDAALEQLASFETPSDLTFHLHGLSSVLGEITDAAAAQTAIDTFVHTAETFVAGGGRFVWTVGQRTSFSELEIQLATRLAHLACCVHVDSTAVLKAARAVFDIPPSKVCILPQGHYIGCYPDFVTRTQARAQLDLAQSDDVILLAHLPQEEGALKETEELRLALRALLEARPQVVLVLAGSGQGTLAQQLSDALPPLQQGRVRSMARPVDEMEMQVFMRAADVALCAAAPGPALVALGFGVPVVAPATGPMEELFAGAAAGALYDPSRGGNALVRALGDALDAKHTGTAEQMGKAARALAQACPWPDFTPVLTAKG